MPDRPQELGSAGIFLRPLGNPVPLAFFALAAGTLTLAAMQLGWFPSSEADAVAVVLIAFVFPLQLLATIFAFLARDGAAAEGMGLSGGGWLVIGLVTLIWPPGATSDALGIFLLAAGVCLVLSATASLSSKAAAAAVIAGTGLRFILTAVYELSGSEGWENIAGIAGLALFLLALCAGVAMTFEDARQGDAPLPIGRGEGGEPVESSAVDGVEREPGVRPKL
jgi:succinate-acetate transporter protein